MFFVAVIRCWKRMILASWIHWEREMLLIFFIVIAMLYVVFYLDRFRIHGLHAVPFEGVYEVTPFSEFRNL